MKATKWTNGLGWDVGETEVWIYKDAFGVRSLTKTLRVPYFVTVNPMVAAALCDERGLVIADLEAMDYQDANALYFASAPKQSELSL